MLAANQANIYPVVAGTARYALLQVVAIAETRRLRSGSAERERKGLHARIEKLDLELSIDDRIRLSYQLVQPRFGYGAVTLILDINSVGGARRLSVDEHTKSHGFPSYCGSHDEVQIASDARTLVRSCGG